MSIASHPKAILLGLGIISVTVLMALGKVDSAAGLPVLTALSGYAVGNGVAAMAGKHPDPVITTKRPKS
jgi:hypothetical protein